MMDGSHTLIHRHIAPLREDILLIMHVAELRLPNDLGFCRAHPRVGSKPLLGGF
jgi:hypothetical protein